MPEDDQAKPLIPIGYGKPAPPSTDPAFFWLVYAMCVLISFFVRTPFEMLVFGRPGDRGILCFSVMGTVLMSVISWVLFASLLHRMRPRVAIPIGAALGLTASLHGIPLAILFSLINSLP